jgi:aspartyl aminopeptidase
MEKKMQTREEYDNWLLQFTTNYVLTKKMGRRYAKAYFKTLEEAKHYKQLTLKDDPSARMVIYAITEPKERLYPVEVPIA